MSKKFLIIGVGRFGKSILRELHLSKFEVVACDKSEKVCEEVDSITNHTIIGDASEDSVLADLEPETFDQIVVSMGDDFESAIIIVKKLKDLKCKDVIVKANDRLRGEVLSAVGADRVIYPEEETGTRLARQMASPGILDYIELAPDCSGIEMEVPRPFLNKSLSELAFRAKYKSTVVMIVRNGKPIISPHPDETFEEGDFFFVVGTNKDLEKLKRISDYS